MKTIILLSIISFFISQSGVTQQPKRTSYLVLYILGHYDRKNQRDYFYINAEKGNPDAAEIYTLITWYTDKRLNEPATYYMDRTDSTTKYYNYFQNTTEALLFLGSRGWELVTVNNSVSADYGTYSSQPYTTLKAIPTYYLKKVINQ